MTDVPMTPARLYHPARCLSCGWLYRGVTTGRYLCLERSSAGVVRQVEPVEPGGPPPDWCPSGLRSIERAREDARRDCLIAALERQCEEYKQIIIELTAPVPGEEEGGSQCASKR